MKKITVVNDETSLDQDFFNTLQDNVEEVFNGNTSMGSIRVENIESKNLAKSCAVGGTSQYATSLYIDFDLEPNTQYTVSINSNLVKNENFYPNEKLFKDAKWISTSGRLSFTGTTLDSIGLPSSDKGYAVLKNHRNLPETPVFSEPQVEKGDTETPYTPYKEFSNKETKSVSIWSGNVYTANSVLNLSKSLEIGKIYIIEFYGLSGLYKSYETFIYTGSKYIQINYYSASDSKGFRYRLECEGNAITISSESANTASNTAITNIFEVSNLYIDTSSVSTTSLEDEVI